MLFRHRGCLPCLPVCLRVAGGFSLPGAQRWSGLRCGAPRAVQVSAVTTPILGDGRLRAASRQGATSSVVLGGVPGGHPNARARCLVCHSRRHCRAGWVPRYSARGARRRRRGHANPLGVCGAADGRPADHRQGADRGPGEGRRGRGQLRQAQPQGAHDQVRLDDHGGQARADQGQARHRHRGRPDADPRRHDLRRRLLRGEERRRGRDRRLQAVRRRHDQGDLREVPELRRDPAGDGVLRRTRSRTSRRRSTRRRPTWSSRARRSTSPVS